MRFDLERLLNGEMPITRDGRKVLDIYISKLPIQYPICAWVEKSADVMSYTKDGLYIEDEKTNCDLVHTPKILRSALCHDDHGISQQVPQMMLRFLTLK